jgi:hypothetical protein
MELKEEKGMREEACTHNNEEEEDEGCTCGK